MSFPSAWVNQRSCRGDVVVIDQLITRYLPAQKFFTIHRLDGLTLANKILQLLDALIVCVGE